MRPFLDDAAVFHHDDAVCRADSGEAVRDDNGGAVGHQPFECVLDKAFGFGVER